MTFTCTRQSSGLKFCKILTLKKFFLKTSTSVYLYRLLSFFNHRRQNSKFLIFTSNFESFLDEIESSLDGSRCIASVQDANARKMAAHQQAVRATPPDLLSPENPEVLRQYLNGAQTRHTDAIPLSDHLIAQFFIIQSELSDQQKARLISAMSLRNISLENYTYEMMKTPYHDLLITTRTSIQDPSTRPPSTS